MFSNYPPGVSGMEPEIAGDPAFDEYIEKNLPEEHEDRIKFLLDRELIQGDEAPYVSEESAEERIVEYLTKRYEPYE